MSQLILPTKNSWCPGCGNFGILKALEKGIEEPDRTVAVSGIGCHGKIVDYLNLSSFYGLHGRPVPVATGIKLATPHLKVVAFSGDGDSLNEGISHLIHAAKRNNDITVILHQNRNFALTVKQFTATSPRGFISNSSPSGNIEDPLNPLDLMDASGSSFIARGSSLEIDHLSYLIREAISHRGFSFLEVLQPCVAWFDTTKEYKEKTYKMEEIPENYKEKIKEWDYNNGSKIPLGIFKKEEKETFEDRLKSGEKEVNLFEIANG